MRTALGDRRESLAARGLSLDASLPSSPLFVDADPARIAQAVGNLLDNAEKFTDPGGRIAVTLERDADGRGAAITVRDTGIGMSARRWRGSSSRSCRASGAWRAGAAASASASPWCGG